MVSFSSGRPNQHERTICGCGRTAFLFWFCFGFFLIIIGCIIFGPKLVAKRDCKDDGFGSVVFTSNQRGVLLKYKFIEDSLNDDYYNFDEAVVACRKLGASLWEILYGQEEWYAVMAMARPQKKARMWINAEVVGSCPGKCN